MEISINTPFIKLDQLLKYSGICPSGKDAKDIIKANLIKVDGITENKRGRKIYKDMTVFIESENLELKVK